MSISKLLVDTDTKFEVRTDTRNELVAELFRLIDGEWVLMLTASADQFEFSAMKDSDRSPRYLNLADWAW